MDLGTTRREPSRIFPGTGSAHVTAEQAAAFLDSLSEKDRNLFTLSHGLGLDLGTVSYALHMDSSIVSWRLRRALMASEIEAEPAELERGVAALFAEAGGGAWDPSERLERMPAATRERLAARLASHAAGAEGDEARSGLGIGAVVLILIAMIGFIAYGVIRDEDPMWRGKARMRQGQFEQARKAFRDRGNLPEARALTAITWLAEGNFDKALQVLAEPAAMQYLASFRPMDAELEQLDVEPGSTALLPRGLITTLRPEFVFVGGQAGELSVEQGVAPDVPSGGRARVLKLPERPAAAAADIVRHAFPANWAALKPGPGMWAAPGAAPNTASFTVMSPQERQDVQRHARLRLSHEIPLHARSFLRGHYYLRSGLYTQAGNQFRDLALAFPDESYPREMLARIGAALGVDPAAFLR